MKKILIMTLFIVGCGGEVPEGDVIITTHDEETCTGPTGTVTLVMNITDGWCSPASYYDELPKHDQWAADFGAGGACGTGTSPDDIVESDSCVMSITDIVYTVTEGKIVIDEKRTIDCGYVHCELFSRTESR